MEFSGVKEHIEKNKEAMLNDLSFLISIPSVAVRTEGNAPFGENVQRAYEAMMKMAEREGFETFNADNFGGHIDFPGSGEGIVGVVGHLDVVPEGDNWDFDPYGGEISEGFVKGRGAVDDKGPVIASFYAMKALKEKGYKIPNDVSLIGFDDIPYSSISSPTLTTIHVQRKIMGKQSVIQLMQLIEDPRFMPMKTQITGKLVERSSVKHLA